MLVVDDDPTFRLVARTSLEAVGFEVEEAENGQTGIARFEETRPDLVLLDIRMPEMDGFEACAAIRGLPHGRQTPIVMLTGLHDPESIEKAYEVGATDFISKPVNYAILNHRLQQILSSGRAPVDFDALTGLPARDRLLGYLRQALGRRPRSSVAVLCVDLDDFEGLNGRLGAHVGDKILREAAERLQGLESVDYLARGCDGDDGSGAGGARSSASAGGDEFIVVLPEVDDLEDCAAVARQIRECLARPFRVAGGEVGLTASVGISAHPHDGEEPRTLLRHAEVATSRAREKQAGCQFYRESLNLSMQRSLSVEAALRELLEQDELEVDFQPRLDVQQGRLAGMEALARWPGSLRAGSPEEVVAIAERSGLVAPLGELLFRTACARTAELKRMGLPTPGVSIRLSAAQFRQERLASRLGRVADELRLDPKLVELAVTEGILMEDPEASVATLRALRDRGFALALDDFGSGSSSLSDLKRFSLDTLEIDASFVRDVAKESDAAIAKAIVALGHALSLKVLANGVEGPKQLQFLRAQGCDAVQGSVFSGPLPFAELVEWVSDWETTSSSLLQRDARSGPAGD